MILMQKNGLSYHFTLKRPEYADIHSKRNGRVFLFFRADKSTGRRVGACMSITINNFSFARNRQMNLNSGLKSTKEKIARQEKCENQVKFWENQKKNLQNWEGNTIEDIARKLEMFHSYEDQINAAKAAYNNEQMWHMLDEAKERAEKLAEHLEETAPKTPEERKEDLVEEALGTDENKGALSEILDGMEEVVEDLESMETLESLEELEKAEDLEQIEETAENLQQGTVPADVKAADGMPAEEADLSAMEVTEEIIEVMRMRGETAQEYGPGSYKRFDRYI